MPDQEVCKVAECVKISPSVYSLTLEAEEIAALSSPGQFVHVVCGDGNFLRRPISISGAREGRIRLIFEARGNGTEWLAGRRAGDSLDLLGPLGRGFNLTVGETLVVGGGIGVPPLLFAAETALGGVTAVLGFRDADHIILSDDFDKACREVYITTDDGSFGEKGTVVAPLKKLLESGRYEAVLACGPKVMLSAVAAACAAYSVACQVSMEERMGCGVGACLVCACETKKDGRIHMSRVCRDGPVFNAGEVVW